MISTLRPYVWYVLVDRDVASHLRDLVTIGVVSFDRTTATHNHLDRVFGDAGRCCTTVLASPRNVHGGAS
jgi:hypothetical protein